MATLFKLLERLVLAVEKIAEEPKDIITGDRSIGFGKD